jgi:hypothetical protein
MSDFLPTRDGWVISDSKVDLEVGKNWAVWGDSRLYF